MLQINFFENVGFSTDSLGAERSAKRNPEDFKEKTTRLYTIIFRFQELGGNAASKRLTSIYMLSNVFSIKSIMASMFGSSSVP